MKKGFTILELLVVISVLVILVGIAIPRFKGMQDAARVAQARAELKTIQSAVESYNTNHDPHAYPASSTTLGADVLANENPRVIPSTIPYDPFGGTTTTEYKYVSNGGFYVIASAGAANADISTLAISSSTGAVTNISTGYCVTNGTGC